MCFGLDNALHLAFSSYTLCVLGCVHVLSELEQVSAVSCLQIDTRIVCNDRPTFSMCTCTVMQDLPISLEQDQALDKAQFMLWIIKLHERLMVEDKEEKIEQENILQNLLDSGTLLSDRAARVRAQLAEVSPLFPHSRKRKSDVCSQKKMRMPAHETHHPL